MDKKIIIIGNGSLPNPIHKEIQGLLDEVIAKEINKELLELLSINSLAAFDMAYEITNTPKDTGNNIRSFLEKKYKKNKFK
jgi:hypothetical protein